MGTESKLRAQRRAQRAELAPWTPFGRATPAAAYSTPTGRDARISAIMTSAARGGLDISLAEAAATLDESLRGEWYRNSRYTVIVRRYDADDDEIGLPIAHLSIKRNDKEPPGPERWRDFQRIKDELVGPEYEAVELYPATSRVVDTANQYHLWVVLEPGWRFPFGFRNGLKLDHDDDGSLGARQRPFSEG